jgi:hypothetical protein
MSKPKLIFFILLTLAIAASLVWGILEGHPQDIRMEASSL